MSSSEHHEHAQQAKRDAVMRIARETGKKWFFSFQEILESLKVLGRLSSIQAEEGDYLDTIEKGIMEIGELAKNGVIDPAFAVAAFHGMLARSETDWYCRYRTWDALVKLDHPAVIAVFHDLAVHGQEKTSTAAIQWLRHLDHPDVPILLYAGMADPNLDVRKAAEETIAKREADRQAAAMEKRYSELVYRLQNESNPSIRSTCVDQVVQLGSGELHELAGIMHALLAAKSDPSPLVRIRIPAALVRWAARHKEKQDYNYQKMAEFSVTEELKEMHRDEDPSVAGEAKIQLDAYRDSNGR